MGRITCIIILITFFSNFILSCKSDKREVVISRYDSGSKKAVYVYKGKGSEESLHRREGYFDYGKIAGGSGKTLRSARQEEVNNKGFFEVLEGKRFISEREIKDRDNIEALERMTIDFKNNNIMERKIEVNFCDGDGYDNYLSMRSTVKDSSGYVTEKNALFNEFAKFDDWVKYVGKENAHKFALTLYSAMATKDKKVSQALMHTVKVDFIFEDSRIDWDYVVESGGPVLRTIYGGSGKGLYEMTKDLKWNRNQPTGFLESNELVFNNHNHLISESSYHPLECE